MANTHSLDLEASSSQYAYITDADQTGLDLTSTFTLEGWIKFESFGNSWNWFIFKANGSLSADKRSYFFGYEYSDKSLRLGIYNGTKINQSQVSWEPELDTWYHVAVTFDSNQVKFFVNGSQQGTTQTNTYSSANNGSADFNFGTDKNTFYTDGKFDDWRVWNDVRTPTEIADNYKKELVGNEAGLVGYWKFNNDATDTTSNNNDLTLSGSPSYSTDVPPLNLTLAVDTMALAFTYADVTLKKAIKLVVDTMALSFTFADVIFNNALTLIVDKMALSLTYADVTLKKAVKLVVNTMSLVLDFKNVILKKIGWNNDTKPSDTWTNDSK